MMAQFPVSLATEAHLPSLSTIGARAFHKSNEYFRTTLPDTPLVRQWWSNIFQEEIEDPNCNVLIIRDLQAAEQNHVAGVLLLRKCEVGDSDAGAFKRHPPTADHDKEKFAAMLGADSEDDPWKRVVAGKRRFNVSFFGVDAAYQGNGLGTKLLKRACEMINEGGIDCFVQANQYAKAFYENVGFVVVDEWVLPGPPEYGEAALVYSPRK